MNIVERLSENRKNFWNGVLERTNQKLEEYLSRYQCEEGCVSESYNIKFIVKYETDYEYHFEIYFRINDESYNFDDGDCIEKFKSDKAVRQYLDFLNLQLSDIADEDYTVIMLHSEFSVEEMKDNEEVCILELELRLKID